MSGKASLSGLLAEVASALAATGIEEPRREARLLVEHACGLSRSRQIADPHQNVNAAAAARLLKIAARRAGGEPFARITGICEFWSLEFTLGPDTLVPRPDSETIVATALEHVADRQAPLALLDLGTGTGCLLLALLSELPQAHGTGLDIAPGAVETARENAVRLGLDDRASFIVGDWSAAALPVADLLVANPPYIARGDIADLAPEVALHDPRTALDGGRDGLDAYRAIAGSLGCWLASDGVAVLEVGHSQQHDVNALFSAQGWTLDTTRRDLGGVTRALVLRRARPAASEKELGNDR